MHAVFPNVSWGRDKMQFIHIRGDVQWVLNADLISALHYQAEDNINIQRQRKKLLDNNGRKDWLNELKRKKEKACCNMFHINSFTSLALPRKCSLAMKPHWYWLRSHRQKSKVQETFSLCNSHFCFVIALFWWSAN